MNKAVKEEYNFRSHDILINMRTENVCLLACTVAEKDSWPFKHVFPVPTDWYMISVIKFFWETILPSFLNLIFFRCGILLDPWMFPIKSKIDTINVDLPLLILTTEQFDEGVNNRILKNLIARFNPSTTDYLTIR